MIWHENGQVAFWARDKSKTGNQVAVRLSGVEFVRRWSLHILPSGFHRVRYYGGMHPSKRHAFQQRCRTLLGQSSSDHEHPAASVESSETPPAEATLPGRQLEEGTCPDCGGQLRLIWSAVKRRAWSEVLDWPWAPAWYSGNGL